mgnify:CR=1 FL=1
MFSRKKTVSSTNSSCKLQQAKEQIAQADAILIGAGSGLSTAASLTYDGERFERLFGDFGERYGITDMYSGGFYPFGTSVTTAMMTAVSHCTENCCRSSHRKTTSC